MSVTKHDWELILHALQCYVIQREEFLSTQNVGDREWNELAEYNKLITDIQVYRL